MKFPIIIALLFLSLNLLGQEKKVSKTRFAIGFSEPEFFHAGLLYRVFNGSQVGLSAGAAPGWGMILTTLSLEHRLYMGKSSKKTNRKLWFFRQGTTFFLSSESAHQFTLNLTVGKDFVFKNIKNGITIDAGVFYLPDGEKSLNPTLRFQFYFYFKKFHRYEI